MVSVPVRERVGLLADRPNGARRVGAKFYATDAHALFEWNGAAWVEVEPFAQYDKLILRGQEFAADVGATLTVSNNVPGWSFADAATQGIVTTINFPVGWNRFDVWFSWVNLAAGAGNVRWQAQVKNLSVGIDSTVEAPAADVLSTDAAGSQNIVALKQIINDQPVNPGIFGSIHTLRIARIGADGADTLAGAILVPVVFVDRTD